MRQTTMTQCLKDTDTDKDSNLEPKQEKIMQTTMTQCLKDTDSGKDPNFGPKSAKKRKHVTILDVSSLNSSLKGGNYLSSPTNAAIVKAK